MKTETSAVSEEVAEKELIEFYKHFSLENESDEDILSGLSVAKRAVMEGLLSFNEDKEPKFKLKHPVKNDNDEVTLSEITFKTRIFPNDHIRLSKGLNIQKETMAYAMRCTAHLAGLPSVAYLNKLSKYDYTVLQQVGTVFA